MGQALWLAWQRWLGIVVKEFIQLKRDRLTFAMIIGIPLVQVVLFGFAINSDPRHLPTAVVMHEGSPYSRSLLAALQNSSYFDIAHSPATEEEAARLLQQGEVQFVITIPDGFQRALLRGQRPTLLIEADATDPAATSSALAAISPVARQALNTVLPANMRLPADGVSVLIHRHYNPEGITAYNIVPGLIGVVLTLTMVLMTGLAMTRERERGTFEHLLATPATALEVMTGKIVPYILIGLAQVSIILLAARYIFHVPMVGSLGLLYLVVLLFISANLALGITFSTLARNQLQAMQLTIFFFLPSMLLSGFMFPFRGMPHWAQAIGNGLPLTHFLQLVRGILLKGSGLGALLPHIWPIGLFMLVVLLIGLKGFRKTLD